MEQLLSFSVQTKQAFVANAVQKHILVPENELKSCCGSVRSVVIQPMFYEVVQLLITVQIKNNYLCRNPFSYGHVHKLENQ